MKILLDAGNDYSATLIVKHNTGIFYTAQVDGMGCRHPECEGFLLEIGNFDFDDCKYGCHYISTDESLRLKLANDLDVFLKSKTEHWMFNLSFDFDNINQLMEGWWPVVLTGDYQDNKNVNWKGFIHIGNCD